MAESLPYTPGSWCLKFHRYDSSNSPERIGNPGLLVQKLQVSYDGELVTGEEKYSCREPGCAFGVVLGRRAIGAGHFVGEDTNSVGEAVCELPLDD